jgi:hypothetical protein
MSTNKTQEMPCIPTKPYECISLPWSVGKVHDKQLPDACALAKHKKCRVFLASLMHVCHCLDPWTTCVRLSMQKRRASTRRFKMGTCQLWEKPCKKTSILQDCWRFEWVWQPNQKKKKKICREIFEGRLGPTQGCRATDGVIDILTETYWSCVSEYFYILLINCNFLEFGPFKSYP